jgi:hypothetical protein
MLVSGMHSQNCILSRCKLPSAAARNPAWPLPQLRATCGNWLEENAANTKTCEQFTHGSMNAIIQRQAV